MASWSLPVVSLQLVERACKRRAANSLCRPAAAQRAARPLRGGGACGSCWSSWQRWTGKPCSSMHATKVE